MRLLHVAPTWWPALRYGGTIVSTRGLCRALARGGDEVRVLATSVDGAGDSPVPHGRAVDDGGAQVRYCRSRWLRRLYWSPSMRRALAAEAGHADLVHAHAVFLWPTWAAARAARRAGKPFVLSPRGMLVRSLIEARSRLAKRAWIALVERANLRAAAAIHATSEHEREALLDLGLGPLPRIAVIPNGVDLPQAGSPPPGRRRVLFLGRLSAEKRPELLLEALARVDAASLEIVGPDPAGLGRGLARRAAELGLAGRVVLGGPTDAAGVQAALARSDVLVLASRSENFGNVVVEAMAARRPVVVTPAVGAAALVRAAGAGHVADDDAASVAAAIARLLDHPGEAAAMGAAGGDFVARELSWDAVAARMRALYAELAGARR